MVRRDGPFTIRTNNFVCPSLFLWDVSVLTKIGGVLFYTLCWKYVLTPYLECVVGISRFTGATLCTKESLHAIYYLDCQDK
jgi:hypothetical protein